MVACAVDGEAAYKWFSVVEKVGATLDPLGDSGNAFKRLDTKIASWFTSNLKAYLREHLTREQELWQNLHDIPLKGRQMYWLAMRYYAVDKHNRQIYDMQQPMRPNGVGTASSSNSTTNGSMLSLA